MTSKSVKYAFKVNRLLKMNYAKLALKNYIIHYIYIMSSSNVYTLTDLCFTRYHQSEMYALRHLLAVIFQQIQV